MNENKVVIKFKFSPNIPLFNTIDYETTIKPNFPIATRNTVYDPKTGEITFTFTYDEPLNTKDDMSVSFVPPSQNVNFYYTPKSILSLPYTTNNNLALKTYSPKVYEMQGILNFLIYALMGLSLLGFLFALIFSSKLMGVEMMMVVQIAFVGLITIDKL